MQCARCMRCAGGTLTVSMSSYSISRAHEGSPLCHHTMHSAVIFSLQSFVAFVYTRKPIGLAVSHCRIWYQIQVSDLLPQSCAGSSWKWTALNFDPEKSP